MNVDARNDINDLINGDPDELTALSQLIEEQEAFRAKVELEKDQAMDSIFIKMLKLMKIGDYTLADFMTKAESRYIEKHGESPLTLGVSDLTFTDTGKRRIIPPLYRSIDGDEVSAGRGKMPKWMIAEMNKYGLEKDDFLLENLTEKRIAEIKKTANKGKSATSKKAIVEPKAEAVATS